MQRLSEQKWILITGGTSGLGHELTRLFLKEGYSVIVTGRKSVVINGFEGKYNFYSVDFADMEEVGVLTRELCKTYNIELIINNAGILSPPYLIHTVNGFEYTLQVNFLSHLLINEIVLRNTMVDCPVKIVAVATPVLNLANKSLGIVEFGQSYNALRAYSSSKLFLSVMCEFLPTRYPGLNLNCFSFDPGVFRSSISRMQKSWFRRLYNIAAPFMKEPATVAKTLFDILIKEKVGNGMICDTSMRFRSLDGIDDDGKKLFFKGCYELIDKFI